MRRLHRNNYYSLLSKTGSTGIISVNYSYARYGTGADPALAAAKYAADWVRYDNGRTRYWEIGNENFGSWEKGWNEGDNHGLFADGEPGITRYTPRAPFFYMYYFQKCFSTT